MKTSTRYFRVVNLSQYQHYTKRNPPWIKLHASTLEDYDFARLQDASKMHLCAIWLLASRTDNKIPWDSAWIARRINATAEVDLNSLQDAGFIEFIGDASNMLAPCKQSALPETETETEGDGKRETKAKAKREGEGKTEKPLAGPLRKSPAKTQRRAESFETWEAYTLAYSNRYGTNPVRNKLVNSQMAQFITRVPPTEAPAIAQFYLTHNDAFYIRKAHPVGLLLSDSEKLHTEWQTGRKVTGLRARQDEGTATNFDNAQRAIERLERSEHE